jgi:hypothetical protein
MDRSADVFVGNSEQKVNTNIYGCTEKRWSLGMYTDNYGGIGKRWSFREFFISRSADDFIGRSAQKINTNIYGCTGKLAGGRTLAYAVT